jgi:thiamine-phosphate pyrophosphorylase
LPYVLPHLFCLVSSHDDLTLLPALASAGVDGFQVRDKTATTRELVALATRVRDAAPGACVTVDDRIDVALAAGAARCRSTRPWRRSTARRTS